MRIARAHVRAVSTSASCARAGVFDAVSQWFGAKTASSSPLDALLAKQLVTGQDGDAPSSSSAFTIDAYVDLLERASAERTGDAPRHAAEVSFEASRARAYASSMRASERENPASLTAARVAAIAREVPNGTHAEVSELLKTYALTRAMMRRARESLSRGGASTPTSAEEFTRVITEHDRSMTREDRQNEAKSMRGAYPNNRPCPCGSNKKFKRCCGGG